MSPQHLAAFATSAAHLLRRGRHPAATRLPQSACVASAAGRGVWDLPAAPRRPPRRHGPDDADPRVGSAPRDRRRDAPPPRRPAAPERRSRWDEDRDARPRHRDREPSDWGARDRRAPEPRPPEWDRRVRWERRDGDSRGDFRPGPPEPRRQAPEGAWAGRRPERHRPDEAPSEVQLALAADDDLLYGVAPVLHALRAGRRAPTKLYVQERRAPGGPQRKAANDAALERVLTLAAGLRVPLQRLSKGDLNVLAANRPHQGLVLRCAKLEYEDLKEMHTPREGRPECWLVLDEVSDPQNAGALLRSAYFLGADGVIACKRNSAALTPVVSKASAGALEVMPVRGVSSMPRFLRAARRDGWRVVGTALEDTAVDAKQLTLDRSTLVVMGSEGHGLRAMVKDECDVLVGIRGEDAGDDAVVDSLNVSVAAAIALYQLLGK